MKHPFRTTRRQHGAVLVVGLLLLMVMTVLGISSLKTVTMEERMSANTYDRNLAFQAAEAALRVGEDDAVRHAAGQSTTAPTIYNDLSICPNNTIPCWQDLTWTGWTDVDNTTLNTLLTGNANERINIPTPQYIVEDLGTINPCYGNPLPCRLYRITARSRNADPNSMNQNDQQRALVILQSLYIQ